MLCRVRVLSHLEASRCGELALRGEEPRDMFSHIFLGVADFERALSFYRALMPVLGIRERFCERERPWAGWQSEPGPRPLFLIGVPYDGQSRRRSGLCGGAGAWWRVGGRAWLEARISRQLLRRLLPRHGGKQGLCRLPRRAVGVG